ncbi:Hypothetical protein A7982_11591 [Minicystis rosea]|nr:Hypothetical protein A7982_11591 [Minicystis rosea]
MDAHVAEPSNGASGGEARSARAVWLDEGNGGCFQKGCRRQSRQWNPYARGHQLRRRTQGLARIVEERVRRRVLHSRRDAWSQAGRKTARVLCRSREDEGNGSQDAQKGRHHRSAQWLWQGQHRDDWSCGHPRRGVSHGVAYSRRWWRDTAGSDRGRDRSKVENVPRWHSNSHLAYGWQGEAARRMDRPGSASAERLTMNQIVESPSRRTGPMLGERPNNVGRTARLVTALCSSMAQQACFRAMALLVCSCATPHSEAPTTVQTSPSSSSAPLVDRTIISVASTRAPVSLVIDGDLREWGALPPALPSLSTPIAYDEPDAKAESTKAPNPPRAASRLAFALTAQGAVIAAELGDAARDGIWLGIGSVPADLPLPGHYMGNLGYVSFGLRPEHCATTPKLTEDGEGYYVATNSPAAVAACQAEIARHMERKKAHARRFTRLYRIDQRGVRVVSEGSKLVAIDGAKWAFNSHTGGTMMEASIPLDALPRMAEAPLKSVRLFARAALSSELPTLDAWVWLDLLTTFSFEPYGELRAHAFRRALDYGPAGLEGSDSTTYRLPRGLSYQPGDPLHLEVVDSSDCVTLAAREVPLYKKEASLGDVEVGYVAAPRGTSCAAEIEPWLAIFVKGKLASIEPSGSPRGTVRRGEELHVLSFAETRWSPVGGTWSVIALASDGTRRTGVIEPVAGLTEPGGKDPYWDNVSDFTGPDFSSFGWRGSAGKRGLEAIWHWDETRKVYRGKQRSIPLQQGHRQ